MRVLDAFLQRYAWNEAAALAPFVVGRRLLDLGGGEGYVAAALRNGGRFACSVDVGPFRRTSGPYVIYDGVRLPIGDAAFDTTLISLALHHCEKSEAVLDEALRVTRRRVLVVESIYRNRFDRFCLNLLDGRLNRRRHGGRMNVPLAFRRAEEWQALFDSRGLRTVARRWLGGRWERLVHHPLLYVLDK